MTDPTNAGIIQVGEDRWIPGSRRADGSYRKERKVRPGFVPQEDVQRYSNSRLEAAKQPAQQASIPGAVKKPTTTVEKKPVVQQTPPAVDQTKEKRIKALNKKLRQIADLEQKLIKGGTLNEEQRDKVKKGKAIRAELAQLEASQ
ncbi:hypothetical protein A0J61_03038 [Choanephora cucurbitarum]|uniref:WIBG Mago-binding domain-containing protein n=1 Tax=Choanephora cucurbitarum TaxID=101091 RepID=A0A1C7NNQ3_9FUNG|nr:hypothetical protein A0J61_03038 [Choanephora cucurbitarum]